MEARLFRVEEVTGPGTLPAGDYAIRRGDHIILDIALREPITVRDLQPLVIDILSRRVATA